MLLSKAQKGIFAALHQVSDSISGDTLVEIVSDKRVLIENHKGIVGYEADSIVVRSKQGRLHISGKTLTIRELSKSKLIIRGKIEKIEILKGGENENKTGLQK